MKWRTACTRLGLHIGIPTHSLSLNCIMVGTSHANDGLRLKIEQGDLGARGSWKSWRGGGWVAGGIGFC